MVPHHQLAGRGVALQQVAAPGPGGNISCANRCANSCVIFCASLADVAASVQVTLTVWAWWDP
ncbi:hypothetical protein ABZ656_12975 [Streptomyces sp. NPDC007095]|jgi:hypothetical protein|uniref:hypothetical protein n=1 Tax=Streptomyces sp. NPDC007095 TaxID=3154482 RepID=UPI000C700C74